MQLDPTNRNAASIDLGVLVVESDEGVRRLLVSQLERLGARCHATGDRAAALELLEKEEGIRKVLIELTPGGEELALWVRAASQVRPEAALIGVGGEGSQPDLLAQGIHKVLAKPWRIPDLRDSLAD